MVVTQPLLCVRAIAAGVTPTAGTLVAMVTPVQFAALMLAAAAAVGLVVAWVQIAALWRHVRRPPLVPKRRPPISILKPLCGLDDRLAGNLLSFADLPYPSYEVLLGVRDA